MRILLATVIALIVLVPAAAAGAQSPPAAITGPAQSVGASGAVVTGTVDPNGAAASYHFEYGTTVEYGLETPVQLTGAVDGDVAVQATLNGLSPNTTYHYRLVAGGARGADATFRTTAGTVNPAVPRISRLSAVEKTTTAARLTALIDPNRAATSYQVEWGTSSTQLGNRTPAATLPGRDGYVAVSVPLAGLPPHTRIHWRVVATNAAGTKRSGVASFTTLRAPIGISLRVFPDRVDWSGTVSVSGRVEGAGVNGLTVALEQATFPYTGGFQAVATARTGKSGDFRFPARQVFAATRLRAVTRTSVSVTSAAVEALVRPRVGIRRSRQTRRSLHLTGRVQPGLPAGRATLQRRSSSGGWTLVRRRALLTPATDTSTYRFKVRRLRRAAVYRVKVAANDGGAHLGAASRGVLVGKRRGR